MFSKIFTWLAKQLNPMAIVSAIVKGLTVDIDTVEKQDGKYLRVRVEWNSIKVFDELIAIGETSKVDFHKSPEYEKAIKYLENRASKRAIETLKNANVQ